MPVADKVTVELELRDQQYNARLISSERAFKRSMDATEKAAENAARDINQTMGQVPEDLKRKYRELGGDIGRSFQGASRAAQLAFGVIVAYSLNAARKAEDINDAFAFTFSNISKDADKAAERIATSFNRTSSQVKEGLSNSYQILTGVGIDSQRAFQASQAIVERSIDLASQKGISDARAYQAIISGLTGESEPLKALGVVINETTVGLELQRLGFKGATSDATEAQKALARYNLILAKTSTAQGDVARTSDSANNKLKEAQTAFENAAVSLGNELLPSLVKVAGAATDVLKAFNDLPDGVQTAGLAFLGFIAAAGPIAGLIANLAKLRAIAIETRLALAAVGGAGGAGAGAAGAAGGAALGLIPSAAIGAGLLVGTGSFIEQPTRTREVVQRNLDATRRLRPGDTRSIQGLQAELDLLNDRQRTLEALNASTARTATTAADTVIGGFGLGALGNTGNASGSGGRGRSGSGADPLRELKNDLARIQEGALTDAERAAKDLSDTLKTIDDAVKNGLLTRTGANSLSAAVAGQDHKRPDPVVLESLGNDAIEIGKSLSDGFTQRQKEQTELYAAQGQDAARSFIDIVRSENIGESIGYAFQNAAFNNIEKYLGQIFSSLFQSQGGGGIGGAISSFFGFGGGRAAGGPVRAGFSYDVGESGREKFVAPANGFIMPNMGAQAKSAPSASTINVRQSFDLTGVSGDAAIYSNVSRMIAQGQRQTLQVVKTQAPSAQLEQRLLRD